MKVLVSGANGVIGRRLVPGLKRDGHSVIRLTRSPQGCAEPEIAWNPRTGEIDRQDLSDVDAAVHLAGESIAGIWTEGKKQEIHESRVAGTDILARTLADLERPPAGFLSASAIGYYGDRGEEVLTEDSAPGSHFLSRVCQDWEKAAEPAARAGLRVVRLRFGIVLSPDDPTFQWLTAFFNFGLGGQLGSGENFISWITIDDAVRAVRHILDHPEIEGPVNIVTPYPVRHRELVASLGEVMSRPTAFKVPESAARAVFGSIADSLLLSSMRVRPQKLLDTGFRYRNPRLDTALRRLLDR